MSRKHTEIDYDTLDEATLVRMLEAKRQRNAAAQLTQTAQAMHVDPPRPAPTVQHTIAGLRIRSSAYNPQPVEPPHTSTYVPTEREEFTDTKKNAIARHITRAVRDSCLHNQRHIPIWTLYPTDFMSGVPSMNVKALRPGFQQMFAWLEGQQYVVSMEEGKTDDGKIIYNFVLDTSKLPRVDDCNTPFGAGQDQSNLNMQPIQNYLRNLGH